MVQGVHQTAPAPAGETELPLELQGKRLTAARVIAQGKIEWLAALDKRAEGQRIRHPDWL